MPFIPGQYFSKTDIQHPDMLHNTDSKNLSQFLLCSLYILWFALICIPLKLLCVSFSMTGCRDSSKAKLYISLKENIIIHSYICWRRKTKSSNIFFKHSTKHVSLYDASIFMYRQNNQWEFFLYSLYVPEVLEKYIDFCTNLFSVKVFS